MKTRKMFATVALGLVLGFPGLAKAQYHFTTYDVPGSTATAVNANSPHAIAGEFDDAGGNTHGFVLSKGVYTQFDVPGAVFTSVNGINASGEISGIYIDAGGTYHGYFRSKGVFTTLDPPGSVHTQAEFLNVHGEVVGVYRDASQTRHGFTWSKGAFTTFDVPGSAAPSRDGGLRDQQPWRRRWQLRGHQWQSAWFRAEQGRLHNARRA